MFITRANRRDLAEIKAFYDSHDWFEEHEDEDLSLGVAFIARQGPIVGCVRLLEREPNILVFEDVLVHRDHRGMGVGRRLLEAAMSARGGTVYLSCHDDAVAFYEKFGFAEMPFESQPETVRQYFEEDGAWPFTEDHVHHFLKAR